jgi:hypothetical protein
MVDTPVPAGGILVRNASEALAAVAGGSAYLPAFEAASNTILAALGTAYRPPVT